MRKGMVQLAGQGAIRPAPAAGKASPEGATMGFAERLRGELSGLLDVIHRAGGGVVFEEFPGALEEDIREAEPVGGESSAARRALIEEANNLAETLERLRHEEDGLAPRAVGGDLVRDGADAESADLPSPARSG